MNSLRPEVIKLLSTLGWHATALNDARFSRYDRSKVHSHAEPAVFVTVPKDYHYDNDPRFILDGKHQYLSDGEEVERLIVDCSKTGWEKKVFLWHGRTTFLPATANARKAEEEAKSLAAKRKQEASFAASFPGIDLTEFNKAFDETYGIDDVITGIAISFDWDVGHSFAFKKGLQEKIDKARRLFEFMKAEGWLNT